VNTTDRELKNRIAAISPVISFWRIIVVELFGSCSFLFPIVIGKKKAFKINLELFEFFVFSLW
jgi:hypothetical protein